MVEGCQTRFGRLVAQDLHAAFRHGPGRHAEDRECGLGLAAAVDRHRPAQIRHGLGREPGGVQPPRLGPGIVDREGDQMESLIAGDRRPVGARKRRIEPVDVGQDLEIAAAQHGASVGGSGRHPVARRIGVAVDRERGEREAETLERRGRRVDVGDEPADMVEEDPARRRCLAGWRRGHRAGALSRPRLRPSSPGSPPSNTPSTGSRRSWCAPCR